MGAKKFRVALHGNLTKNVLIDPSATAGATLGTDLFYADGTIVKSADIINPKVSPTGPTTTDDLDEGGYNLYFTDVRAQHAVGEILTDTDTIQLVYDPSGPSIKANLLQLTAIALTALGSQTVVALDGAGNAYAPNLSVPADLVRIVGVTLNAAAAGAPVQIVTDYHFTETAWGWSPGRIYCAPTGGTLTQSVPTSPGAIVEVARVISPTTIRVGIQPAIII